MVTLAEQSTGGASGGEELARDVVSQAGANVKVLIVTGHGRDDVPFADALARTLEAGGGKVVGRAAGHPHEVRKVLEKITPDKAIEAMQEDFTNCIMG